MDEIVSELTTTTNEDECYKELREDFPLSQYQPASDPSHIQSWPQTFDTVQDDFGSSKKRKSHNLGEEVTHSVSASYEAIQFSGFNYTDANHSLIIPQLGTETFTAIPEFDNDQTSTDTRQKNNEFSKRLQSCVDFLKREENNFTEKNTSSPCTKIPGALLKPNMNLCLTKVEQTCMKLIPLINRTNTQNYSVLLVETLRTCLKDITLEEFYNLLCNSNKLSSESIPLDESKMDEYKNTLKLEGLKVSSFILDIFNLKNRRVSSIVLNFVKNPLIGEVNFEEMCKKFLAIKIIFDFVLVDELSLRYKSVPRTALYKAYCMICKKFPERVKMPLEHSKFNTSGFVGATQFGSLTKLVYPHLKLRRLGRRGNSRHHYVGIMWNKSIVDAEMLKHLELNDLITLRGDTQKKSQDIPRLVSTKIHVLSKSDLAHKFKKSFFSGFADTKYSFVLLATKVPMYGCLPRKWKYFPGRLPQQSERSRQIMETSSMALQKYNINMTPVIHEFHNDIFSTDDLKILLRKFIQRINILIENNSDDEGYFNMYLIILLLIFPVSLATDKEVPREDKVKIRKVLNDFIHGLAFEFANFPSSKLNNLQNFCNIVKKMIHINELSLSHIKTGLVQAIVKEIALDVQKPIATHIKLYNNPAIEEMFFRAVFATANAFESDFFTVETQNNDIHNTEMPVNIVKAFMNCAIKTTEYLLTIPESMSPQELQSSTFDLPFQVFKIETRVLHQLCFSDPFLSKLLIQAIGYILHLVNNELQNLSFGEFGKRESELSSATFKTWWVYSTLSGEYIKILEEIVALSGRLS